jgi:hypothetical protein
MLSDRFIARLKLSEVPAYRLAVEAGASPSWLSRVLHGSRPVAIGDARLLRIGRRLGLRPADVFTTEKGSREAL